MNITHPAALLHEPGVESLPDEPQNPADYYPDVLEVVGGQCLYKQKQRRR